MPRNFQRLAMKQTETNHYYLCFFSSVTWSTDPAWQSYPNNYQNLSSDQERQVEYPSEKVDQLRPVAIVHSDSHSKDVKLMNITWDCNLLSRKDQRNWCLSRDQNLLTADYNTGWCVSHVTEPCALKYFLVTVVTRMHLSCNPRPTHARRFGLQMMWNKVRTNRDVAITNGSVNL